MKLVIVTGMSEADKTTAPKVLEDMGFYCVDSLPIPLVDKFTRFALRGGDVAQVALGIDIRSDEELNRPDEILRGRKNTGLDFQVLSLDANDTTLTKRYKKTRRSHPLAGTGWLDKGIEEGRVKLAFLRKDTDFIIDTSKLLIRELRRELGEAFLQGRKYSSIFVMVLSSDFKYEIPEDAGLVFDMRSLPNPYYVGEPHPLTGGDQVVRDYVMWGGTGQAFLDKLYDMVDFLLPNYIGGGENQLVIAARCTGGKYRFIAMTNALYGHLAAFGEYGIKTEHRGIGKGNKRKQ